MKTNRSLSVPLLLISILCALPSPSFSSDKESWVRKIIGVYNGVLVSGGKDCPGKTIFVIDSTGNLSGNYDFLESNMRLLGTLRDCKAAGERTLKCTWGDQTGDGSLEMTFNQELTSFNGFWSVPGDKARYPWNGTR